MDMKQKTVVIVAVLIVVIAAVFGAQALNDKHDDKGTVDFIIQDNYGVYFWVEGSGETVYDAFKDAAETYSIPYVPSTDRTTSEENGIQSMYGLEMVQVGEKEWNYWTQYNYNGSEWNYNDTYMSGMKAKDYDVIGIVYGNGSTLPLDATPDVLTRSTEGIVFTIESLSGMYFDINGQGETVQQAFDNAVAAYNFPHVPATGAYGGAGSLFGWDTTKIDEQYVYWEQFSIVDGAWKSLETAMPNLTSIDGNRVLVVYHAYGATTPAFPPIGA